MGWPATWARLTLTQTQRQALVRARRALLEQASDPAIAMGRHLLRRRGVGEMSAWLLTMELFSWRRFRNRRAVAGIMGLAAAPQASGDRRREQGISKAGSALLRGLALELAWCWLRYQPTSALSRWYRSRFALGGSRQRRIGIVAVARRLMIALWRYVETGQVPSGATMKASRARLSSAGRVGGLVPGGAAGPSQTDPRSEGVVPPHGANRRIVSGARRRRRRHG